MPFVDHKLYREQQIKKVIQKHRAKRHRESVAEQHSVVDRKYNKSMPLLHQTLNRVSSKKFSATDNIDSAVKEEEVLRITKRNILHAIKRWFSTSSSKSISKLDNEESRSPYQRKFKSRNSRERCNSAPLDITQSGKTQLDSNSPPGVSPKRQRRRTVSNIGSIMETIDEIPEHVVLEDESDSDSNTDLSSSSDSFSSLSISSSLNSLLNEVSARASFSSITSSHSDPCMTHTNQSSLLPCSA